MKTLLISNLIFFFIVSCSHRQRGGASYYKKNYKLVDSSGEFVYARESGLEMSSKLYVTKSNVKDNLKGKILERSILFSSQGEVRNKYDVLIPQKSAYQVWFEKKLYKSYMNIDREGLITIKLRSPEKQWKGVQKVRLPKGNGVRCFFSQLMECAKHIGYLQKAINLKSGRMAFTIIMEGFPYMREQYTNLPDKPFFDASLAYDGMTEKRHRFSLNFASQSIYYFVDSKFNLDRMFWPQQGVSINAKK